MKSQRASGRSSPSTINVPDPERTRNASCAFSAWYLQSGWPGSRTRMLIPNCVKAASPSPSKRVPRPKSALSPQSAFFAFSTNQPCPSGRRPYGVSVSIASSTAGSSHTTPRVDEHERHPSSTASRIPPRSSRGATRKCALGPHDASNPIELGSGKTRESDTRGESMRRIVLTLVLLALAAPVALAQATYPETIALPNGFAPEGIEIKGNTVYVGSVGSGAIWAGDLRTGAGHVLVPGAPGTRSAAGIEYDHGLLWVSGARFGNALVYDAKTGVLVKECQLATGTAPTFINDAVATQRGVYFTDSQRPVLYKVERSGLHECQVTTIPLSGDYVHVAGQFNLNGIVATPNGKTLIAVQSVARKLYTIDPKSGAAKLIDLGGYDLSNGDGLLLHGRTLYVVQNRDNKVAVFELSKDLTEATFLRAITDPGNLDVPTTIDRAGSRLYVVNARFGTTTPTDQAYHIVR